MHPKVYVVVEELHWLNIRSTFIAVILLSPHSSTILLSTDLYKYIALVSV